MAKILSAIIALTMVLGVFAVLLPSIGAETPTTPAFADPERMDLGSGFRYQPLNMPEIAEAIESVTPAGAPGDEYAVGDVAPYVYANFYDGYWYEANFKFRGDGEHCEIWVALNLNFTSGDPRNDWSRLNITDDMVNYMIDEFDNTIYPQMADVFGNPAPLDGTNSMMAEWFGIDDPARTFQTNDAGKVMIMIYNIRDYSYYNSWYPSYIAGYFSGTSKLLYDRNIMHIDCWDWVNRTGETSPRPYLYETVFVHEYQHLLHDVLDSAEDNWINEGLSMWSEVYVYGDFGIDGLWPYINRYFATPDNSLTDWEDQGDINSLADYGLVGLFMLYTFDHFGGQDFMEALANNEEQGIVSYEAVLADMGYEDWTLADVYRAFRIANLLSCWMQDDIWGDGLYGYTSLDFTNPEAEPWLLTWDWGAGLNWYDPDSGYVSGADYFGDTITYEGYDTDVSWLGGYGTDYIVLDKFWSEWGSMNPLELKWYFDGDDHGWDSWSNTGGYWWSGYGDLRDVSLVGTADLSGLETATLTFDTWWDIEDYWDFGFVQVSADGGMTWTSLANEYTTDEHDASAHPAIVENLPGLTGWNPSWTTMSFDLTEWVGQEVMFRFRYMTDWATYYGGWGIDNVYMNDMLVDNGWDVVGLEPDYPESDFMVSIFAPAQWTLDGMYLLPMLITDVNVEDIYETGIQSLSSLEIYDFVIVMVSSTVSGTDYYFGVGSWIL